MEEDRVEIDDNAKLSVIEYHKKDIIVVRVKGILKKEWEEQIEKEFRKKLKTKRLIVVDERVEKIEILSK